jgi:PhnB protein
VERTVANTDSAARLAARKAARPLADAPHQWLRQQRQRVPDGSATARAIDYSLKRWVALTRYLDDGDLAVVEPLAGCTGFATSIRAAPPSSNLDPALSEADPLHMTLRMIVQQIEFCKAAFDATELSRRAAANGRVIHATLSFYGALFMVHDDSPHLGSRPPESDGSSPVVNYLYCDDVDALIGKAVAAGAQVLIPAADQFWGDRVGRIMDPAHHVWNVSARIGS